MTIDRAYDETITLRSVVFEVAQRLNYRNSTGALAQREEL